MKQFVIELTEEEDKTWRAAGLGVSTWGNDEIDAVKTWLEKATRAGIKALFDRHTEKESSKK